MALQTTVTQLGDIRHHRLKEACGQILSLSLTPSGISLTKNHMCLSVLDILNYGILGTREVFYVSFFSAFTC